jgi:spermidine/putrescine transport system ATP-binding protein
MQIELQNLQNSLGITFVLVTHDQEEALSMSDMVCIMREGRVVQSGSPQLLYDDPVNRYVADFVGRSNFVAGKVLKCGGKRIELKTANDKLFCGRQSATAIPVNPGDTVALMIRPELISISPNGTNVGNVFDVKAQVKNRIFLGEHTEYLVDAPGLGELLVLTPKKEEAGGGGFSPGDYVFVGWSESAALVLGDN